MEITVKDIETNLQTLPKELLEQVNDYVEFLKLRYSEDWSDDLTFRQKASIDKGTQDIKEGQTYSEDKAKEKIRKYFLEKSK